MIILKKLLDEEMDFLYSSFPVGEMSESAEGARLLSEYTGINLYRGFKSLSLRHL